MATEYPIKTSEQLGAVLRGFRREKKLTQAAAASLSGLAQASVSEIEADPGRSSLGRVFRLIAALDLEIVVRPRRSAGRSSDW